MKNPELFFAAITTMLHSWGGDTPVEVIWAMNEFVAWLNSEYGLDLAGISEMDYDDGTLQQKIEVIQRIIENLSKN